MNLIFETVDKVCIMIEIVNIISVLFTDLPASSGGLKFQCYTSVLLRSTLSVQRPSSDVKIGRLKTVSALKE